MRKRSPPKHAASAWQKILLACLLIFFVGCASQGTCPPTVPLPNLPTGLDQPMPAPNHVQSIRSLLSPARASEPPPTRTSP